MSKRARYVGPFPEVVVSWPPGETVPEKQWIVQQGHWLPDDAPAKLRDELTAGPDWSTVDQPTSASKKDGE